MLFGAGSTLHALKALRNPRWEDYNYELLDNVPNRMYWLGDGQTWNEKTFTGAGIPKRDDTSLGCRAHDDPLRTVQLDAADVHPRHKVCRVACREGAFASEDGCRTFDIAQFKESIVEREPDQQSPIRLNGQEHGFDDGGRARGSDVAGIRKG